MQTLFGSLFGLFGTAQLHTALLLGMPAVTIFRPERVASWAAFRLATTLYVVAVALPGTAMLFPRAAKGTESEQWLLQLVLAASGVLTASAIYCLLSCFSTEASPQST